MSEDREETVLERSFKARLDLLRDDTVRETALDMLEDWIEESIELLEMLDQATDEFADSQPDRDEYLRNVKHQRNVLSHSLQNVLDGIDVGIYDTTDPVCREMMRRVGFTLNKTILTLQIGQQQGLLQVEDSTDSEELEDDETI
tara:strand:+ start:4667 stop:5098 length:432 start_codon:yes stop_codon:yes gene_type:complete